MKAMTKNTYIKKQPSHKNYAKLLLRWYDKHQRLMVWRQKPHSKTPPNPYRVWLAEMMLQQTVAKTATPYFVRFLKKWQNIKQLAQAPREQVMAQWAGLGYYHRAQNLHRTANIIVKHYGGRFPKDEKTLQSLPGIGPYSSAAIAAIAFGALTAPIDGNIERVLARLFAVRTKPPKLRARIRDLYLDIMPKKRNGDFAQALMDLGSSHCAPRSPACPSCPFRHICKAHIKAIETLLPKRAPKKARPHKKGVVYCLINRKKNLLMVRRPHKGLLSGMLVFPTSNWIGEDDLTSPLKDITKWQTHKTKIQHIFTHFSLSLTVKIAQTPKKFRKPRHMVWIEQDRINEEALPSVMKKVCRLLEGYTLNT